MAYRALVSSIFVLVAALPSIASANPLAERQNELPAPFDWAKLKPSKDLNWTPCFDNLTCTRLEVPLDYDDPSAGTTAVPFIRWMSKNESAEDLLFNPGGPASSGVLHFSTSVIRNGYIQWLGDQHNLVSFDPRGVNNSDISFSCFPNDAANQNLYDSVFMRGIELDSPQAYAARFARDQAYGKWCSRALKDSPAKYANTVAVARDMLTYLETAKRQAGEDPKTAKLRYFGISYGSTLGMTFATLFPDKVDRMILDGVTDAEEYYAGTWYSSVSDSDDAIRYFFQTCHEAGPDACAFYANSTQQIELRFNKLLDNLSQRPIPVTDQKALKVPQTVTAAELRFTIFWSTYSPRLLFRNVSQILRDVENGNGVRLAVERGFASVNANNTANAHFGYTASEATTQIRCIDSLNRYPMKSVAKLREHVEYLKTLSTYIGPNGATDAIKCTYMDILPPPGQRFPAKLPATVKTRFPILFTSSQIDPVTPLRTARKMSSHFADSVVLQQNSVGHGSYSWFSNCTSQHVQQYLAGKVPAANTTCSVEGNPFNFAASI